MNPTLKAGLKISGYVLGGAIGALLIRWGVEKLRLRRASKQSERVRSAA